MTEKKMVRTSKREVIIDLTDMVRDIVHNSGISEGNVVVYVPHTTAAVAINENADPTVKSDFQNFMSKLIPYDMPFSHMEGNSDAHIKSILVGSSITVPIFDGEMALGTWQGIYFCEFDGPRNRNVIITVK